MIYLLSPYIHLYWVVAHGQNDRTLERDENLGMLLGFTRVYAALLCHVLAASPHSREDRRERGISHKRWKNHPTNNISEQECALPQTGPHHNTWHNDRKRALFLRDTRLKVWIKEYILTFWSSPSPAWTGLSTTPSSAQGGSRPSPPTL